MRLRHGALSRLVSPNVVEESACPLARENHEIAGGGIDHASMPPARCRGLAHRRQFAPTPCIDVVRPEVGQTAAVTAAVQQQAARDRIEGEDRIGARRRGSRPGIHEAPTRLVIRWFHGAGSLGLIGRSLIRRLVRRRALLRLC